MFSPIVFSYFEIEKYIKKKKKHSYVTIKHVEVCPLNLPFL